MTYFVQQGAAWRVSATGDMVVKQKLPAGNYTVKQDQFGNFFLETVAGFTVPSKVYGKSLAHAERMMTTFVHRAGKSTGVLLAGEKGSGKTMLAKLVCDAALKEEMPVIVINHPWRGDNFNLFIQSIEQSAVVLFDEFEKVYDSEEQQQILTLLDGVYPTHKLFILTCNDSWRLDSNLINRPGRIYYHMDFKGLDIEFIDEYCRDNLQNLDHMDSVKRISSLFADFNFDLLQALVEEMNRYNESANDALAMMNIKPEKGNNSSFDLELSIAGQPLGSKSVDTTTWHGNPMLSRICVSYNLETNKVEAEDADDDYSSSYRDNDDDEWKHTEFSIHDLVNMNPKDGKFIFINDEKNQLVLTRQPLRSFSYQGVF